jgi:hypothetical protein
MKPDTLEFPKIMLMLVLLSALCSVFFAPPNELTSSDRKIIRICLDLESDFEKETRQFSNFEDEDPHQFIGFMPNDPVKKADENNYLDYFPIIHTGIITPPPEAGR